MPLTQVTNAGFEAVCATIPAPFGPFTRVGDVADLDVNSHIPVEVTTGIGTTVHVSFDTMSNASLLDKFLQENLGAEYLMHQLKLVLEVITANIVDIDPPPTRLAERREILRSLSLVPTLFGTFPWRAHLEHDPSLKVSASFTGTPDGADLALEQTISGQAYLHLWDFGDGATSLADDPTHTYTESDDYEVRLIVVGAGGVVEVRETFTIEVPAPEGP